jgi:hypothetical protein
MKTKRVKWLRFLASLALIAAAYWLAQVLKADEDVSKSTFLVFAVDLLPLLPVPFAVRSLPVRHRDRIPIHRWIVFVGLIFLAQLAMEYQSEIIPAHEPELEMMFFIFLIGTVAIGAAYVFHRRRVRP